MRARYLFSIVFCVISFLSWINYSHSREKIKLEQKLELSIESSKKNYLTGEILTLNFNLKNKSQEELTISDSLNTDSGYLSVYISQNGAEFKKYYNSTWGRANASRAYIQIKPGQHIKTSATVFWNAVPRVVRPDRLQQKPVDTYYAFPQANTYYLKAVFTLYFENKPNKIESEPIQVIIEEPTGDDFAVWNKIRNRSELAFFIQEGNFLTSKPEEKEKLRQEAEEIFNQYAETVIGRQIGRSLEKFRTLEEKSKTYLQKLKEAKERNP
ncbi:MAG: hypothetical protein M3384_10305 [Acidobacteriota bacterium]|nr:hypothetical protein [Acidobacteriota bacterium]